MPVCKAKVAVLLVWPLDSPTSKISFYFTFPVLRISILFVKNYLIFGSTLFTSVNSRQKHTKLVHYDMKIKE